jgi:hypothetical protein
VFIKYAPIYVFYLQEENAAPKLPASSAHAKKVSHDKPREASDKPSDKPKAWAGSGEHLLKMKERGAVAGTYHSIYLTFILAFISLMLYHVIM